MKLNRTSSMPKSVYRKELDKDSTSKTGETGDMYFHNISRDSEAGLISQLVPAYKLELGDLSKLTALKVTL